jgi:hypothetical protein
MIHMIVPTPAMAPISAALSRGLIEAKAGGPVPTAARIISAVVEPRPH